VSPAAGSPQASFARQVSEAVLGVPGVADLSGGVLHEVSTYLPGDRVPGVRVAEDGVHVHVVLDARVVDHIPATAGAVHLAVAEVARRANTSAAPDSPGPDVAVHVHVDDIADGLTPEEVTT